MDGGDTTVLREIAATLEKLLELKQELQWCRRGLHNFATADEDSTQERCKWCRLPRHNESAVARAGQTDGE